MNDELMQLEVRASRRADAPGYIVQVSTGEQVGDAFEFDTLDAAALSIADCCKETARRAGRVFNWRFAIGIEGDDEKRTLAASLGRSITRYLGYRFETPQ